MKKSFKLTDFKTKQAIIEVVNRLEKSELIPPAQLYFKYKKYAPISIKEAVRREGNALSSETKNQPAYAIYHCILSAHKKYATHVEPHILRILNDPDRPKSFYDLEKKVNCTLDEFKIYFGQRDRIRQETIKSILKVIKKLKKSFDLQDDYDVMHKWASEVNFDKRDEDKIWEIPGVGIATVQHLRMHYGIDTAKPDVQVMNVFKKEFSVPKISEINAIRATEQVAEIMKKKVIEIDKIFVNYGSGSYNKEV